MTINNFLIFLTCVVFFILDKSAIIYIPVALCLMFIFNVFNYQIFKLGISRFSSLGIISIIMMFMLMFNTHIINYTYYPLNISDISINNINYTVNIIFQNLIILFKNLNINTIIFGVVIFPIFWIIKNEIFITYNKKLVYLESLRIEEKDLLNNNKYINYTFYLMILIFSIVYTDFLIFLIILVGFLFNILIKATIKKYFFIGNIIALLLLIFDYVYTYNYDIGLFQSISYYQKLHQILKFNFFIYPKTHILFNNGILLVLILYIMISLFIELIYDLNIDNILLLELINKKIPINEGVYFADINNKPLVLGLEELNQHMYVNATTGGGKTTLFLRMIKDITNKFNMPIIYIDGKGSDDLIHKLSTIANAHKKVFKYFTFRNKIDASGYDFLGVGTIDEIRNKLLNLIGSQESVFYYERLSAFITIFLNIVDRAIKDQIINIKLDIFLLYKLLSNKNKLIELVNLVGNDKEKKYFDEISELKENPAERLYNIFTAIIYSKYSVYLDMTNSKNIINIVNSIKDNEIVLFLLDSSSYPKDTEQWGKIIIDDINASFSSLEKQYPALVIFDEFASYATNSITTSISIHRSKGLHAVIGSQSLETIHGIEKGEIIVSTIIANCNTKILLRTNNQFDLEIFNNNAGTIKDYVMTHQMNTITGGSSTGLGSMRVGNKYKVDFENLRGLPAGVGYIYRVKNNKVEKINVKL